MYVRKPNSQDIAGSNNKQCQLPRLASVRGIKYADTGGRDRCDGSDEVYMALAGKLRACCVRYGPDTAMFGRSVI